MADLDFITALGRVLHDGSARDAFAADPAAFVRAVGLRETDLQSFLQLDPADLEFQARILLRKRFGIVRGIVPRTCEGLGKEAWPTFGDYARCRPPGGSDPTTADAFGFCQHLRSIRSAALCPVEFNRCRFVSRRVHLAIHFVNFPGKPCRPGIQLLGRAGNARHEWRVYLSA